MPYITVAAIARRLGTCEKTARKIATDLPYITIGTRRRFSADALEQYLRRASNSADSSTPHSDT